MNDTTYVGMRYVPVFAEPSQWDISRQYENLMMVTNEGETYISKEFVPTGVELTNEDYWVKITVPSGGSSGGGISYSTEEQDTGTTWIDGEPRYKKTFVQSLNSITTGWNNTLDSSDWRSLRNTKVVKSEVFYERYNRVYSGFLMQFYKDGSDPQLYSPFALNESGTLYVTVWYTKDSQDVPIELDPVHSTPVA